MQLFVLVMMMALLAHGPNGLGPEPVLSGWPLLPAVLGPYVLIAALLWLASRRALHLLDRRPGMMARVLRRLERITGLSRLAVLLLFLADLYLLGWLTWLNRTLGDWILLNDVLAMTPALAVLIFGWWAYYPVDRRLREAVLLRQLDGGGPVWPIASRGRYILSQVRHQLLLLLVPLLALLGLTQAIHRWVDEQSPLADWQPLLIVGAGAVVFLLAPVMIRYIWDTVPLPAGPLRDRLTALCRHYRVKVRRLLLWRTYGGAINGAVMGLIGPLRYILLTDGLLERMDDDQVEAVMAHEIGHIARHHIPWMIVCALATAMLAALVVSGLTGIVELLFGQIIPANATLTALLAARPVVDQSTAATIFSSVLLIAMVLLWAAMFGYISRRFERQADTFAVQHLSQRRPPEEASASASDEKGQITRHASTIMCDALLRVAELNHHPIRKPSWRHGAIQWRVKYLQQLVGTPIDRCPIDRHLTRIRWASAVVVLLGLLIDNLYTI